MKAVILAAGTGSRLGMSAPKSLAVLTNGKTIFDYQIEKISKFVPIDNICVVVGYKKGMLMRKHPELAYVYNEAYAETNTGKSLLKALNKIDDEDVLWLNGDIVFDGKLISKLILANNSCVLVDNKTCGTEEIKYSTDSEGYIKSISKEVFPGEGEALGINLVKRQELPALKKHLALIDDRDYFEKAIENMINEEHIRFSPVNVDALFCHEVDFPEDLEYVRAYLLKNQCF
ncbi:MAG TPA: phosphocholine cytidylyltransferase family protein [Dehalococcoidia bacterium]|nr:phosphocholine cytidylyltransferase family protein [Dehalococcoidia bacterium]